MLQRKKLILVSLLHSEPYIASKWERYTVILRSWKCVLWENDTLHNLRAVSNIVWRSQCWGWSNESKSFACFSYEELVYRISVVMFVEKRNFFLVKSCMLHFAFCIPYHSLVLNNKEIQCFSLHENAFTNKCILSFVQFKSLCLT